MALSIMFPEMFYSPPPCTIRLASHHPRSSVQLAETEQGYRLIAPVPGVSQAGVNVTVTDDSRLNLVARKSSDPGGIALNKSLTLPDDADPSSIRASCVDGVLQLHINKLAVPAPIDVPVEEGTPPTLEDPESVYEFRRTVAGIPASSVKINIEEGTLLKMQATSKQFGSYSYSFTLPERVRASAITAYCLNGLLTIRMPKEPLPKPLVISVKASSCVHEDADTNVTIATLRVPGFSAEDIKLEVHERHLSLQLSRDADSEETSKYWLMLPDDLKDPSSLEAICQDGILTINYPKSTVEERMIEVSNLPFDAKQEDSVDVDMEQ